jgi:hypothetical protein
VLTMLLVAIASWVNRCSRFAEAYAKRTERDCVGLIGAVGDGQTLIVRDS